MEYISLKRDALEKYVEDNQLSYAVLSRKMGIDKSLMTLVLQGERGVGSKFVAGLLNATGGKFEDFFETKTEEYIMEHDEKLF